MPPPNSLVSLPVSTGGSPSVVSSLGNGNSEPTVSSAGSSCHPSVLPQPATTLSALQALLQASTGISPLTLPQSQPGMILSPAADPIPHTLVQRIQNGQFVEMRDLLADNIALLNQLSSLNGLINLPANTLNRTRLREVPSLVSWLYCFNSFVAVRTSDPLTRNMLAFSRLLIREALRHGGGGWMEYDRVFRRQLAINPSLSWNTLEPGLQAATILGQARLQGTFCSLCRECDHDTTQCALAPLQQQVRSTPVTLQTPVGSRPPRRPESLQHICVNWNKGICRRLPCTYRHICATCQLSHRARDCPDTPADSVYKAFITTPTPLFSGRPSTARNS